jgi:hypothetical protein
MPWKQWAFLEKVSSADFQTYMQNQVVPQFTSTSQRDTMWTTPVKGAYCITTDTMTLWVYDGTGWRLSTPVGQRIGATAMLQLDAGQGVRSVGSVPFTLASQRLCRLEVAGGYQQITGASNNAIGIGIGFDTARLLNLAYSTNLPLNQFAWGYQAIWATLAAGAHTGDAQISMNSTVGAARIQPNGYLAVQDYGPI